MRIDGIVISCYRFDVELARICVASIRYWYPHVPVWLLKDQQYGDFRTTEIEKYWNVQVYPTSRKKLGWGGGKLEVLTELPARRFLFLDSDTAFSGRVFEHLETFEENMIVENKDYVAAGEVESQFFSLDGIQQLDPAFQFPGIGFNTGQFVVTTGLIAKEDFNGFLDWQTLTLKHPDVFKMGEQGLLNYVVLRKLQKGELTLRREPLVVWPGAAHRANHIQVADLTPDSGHLQVIHWAGLRWGKTVNEMMRADILLHFERMYYSRIPLGPWLCKWRRFRFRVQRTFVTPLKILGKKMLSRFL